MTRSQLLLVMVAIVSRPAWADPAVRLGARAGVELHDDADAFGGLDLRLSFPRSPLTINPTFDYFADETTTIYQVSVNALHYLPVPAGRVDPYVGLGVNATSFSRAENLPGVDGHGNRVGMNLVAGTCFDLPIASPFVQVTAGIGELDFVSIGAGLVVALDRDARWTGCGRRAP
jgi:hypothetical protein